jgi:glutamate-1-semialdehyde 2,1-aminomutase
LNDLALYAVGLATLWMLTTTAWRRVELSRAKHPSLAGHARLAKRLAEEIPAWEFANETFFRSDGAPPDVADRREQGFDRLAALYASRFRKSTALSAQIADHVPDVEFTSRYRVPFQYSAHVRDRLPIASFVARTDGPFVVDLDGNRFYDLTGSYGVNVFGSAFYKTCIDEANRRARDLGPLLGSYHPALADNVARLCAISGMDSVSFHMSGTEAVMQAVRLARYHTGKSHLVRFAGAYHGWWSDVQPGVGNPLPANETYTLRDVSQASLNVLRHRTDIACVLINPLQALHPNRAAPGDSTLIDSARSAAFDRNAYARWLAELRIVCDERGIVLIFDEVFVGFRIARGGAQEYFGVRADLVTYGKTLGGGLPVGVVCGPRALMRRFNPNRPVDICFARGTFNSHPYVMTAMQAFLEHLDRPDVVALYQRLDSVWNARTIALNERLARAGVPVRVANLSSIWTITYTRPSAYNWMLQYYLRAEGIALSWVGSGRLIFPIDFGDADFHAVAMRFVDAARAMLDEGWWWADAALSDRAIRRRILRESLAHRFSLRPRRAASVRTTRPATTGAARGSRA